MSECPLLPVSCACTDLQVFAAFYAGDIQPTLCRNPTGGQPGLDFRLENGEWVLVWDDGGGWECRDSVGSFLQITADEAAACLDEMAPISAAGGAPCP